MKETPLDVIKALLTSVTEGSFKFQVGEFGESLDKIGPLLLKLGKRKEDFKNIREAVKWINESAEPFVIYREYLKTNDIDKDIAGLMPKNFSNMSNDDLLGFVKKPEGQKLKRIILTRIYPQETPQKLNEEVPEIDSLESAIDWLNSNIAPYQFLQLEGNLEYLKIPHNLKDEIKNLLDDVKVKYGVEFAALNQKQLKKLAVTEQGRRLKRAILEAFNREQTPNGRPVVFCKDMKFMAKLFLDFRTENYKDVLALIENYKDSLEPIENYKDEKALAAATKAALADATKDAGLFANVYELMMYVQQSASSEALIPFYDKRDDDIIPMNKNGGINLNAWQNLGRSWNMDAAVKMYPGQSIFRLTYAAYVGRAPEIVIVNPDMHIMSSSNNAFPGTRIYKIAQEAFSLALQLARNGLLTFYGKGAILQPAGNAVFTTPGEDSANYILVMTQYPHLFSVMAPWLSWEWGRPSLLSESVHATEGRYVSNVTRFLMDIGLFEVYLNPNAGYDVKDTNDKMYNHYLFATITSILLMGMAGLQGFSGFAFLLPVLFFIPFTLLSMQAGNAMNLLRHWPQEGSVVGAVWAALKDIFGAFGYYVSMSTFWNKARWLANNGNFGFIQTVKTMIHGSLDRKGRFLKHDRLTSLVLKPDSIQKNMRGWGLGSFLTGAGVVAASLLGLGLLVNFTWLGVTGMVVGALSMLVGTMFKYQHHQDARFQVNEFVGSLSNSVPLLKKLRAPEDKVTNIKAAVDWLNGSVEPFEAYARYLKGNGSSEFKAGDLNMNLFRNSLKNGKKSDVVLLQELGIRKDDLIKLSEQDLVGVLNKVLKMKDFYLKVGEASYKLLDFEMQNLLKEAKEIADDKKLPPLSDQDLLRLNRALLETIYFNEIRRISKNKVHAGVRVLLPEYFVTLDKKQMEGLANTGEGQRLKRAIISVLYPEEASKMEPLKDRLGLTPIPMPFGNIINSLAIFGWILGFFATTSLGPLITLPYLLAGIALLTGANIYDAHTKQVEVDGLKKLRISGEKQWAMFTDKPYAWGIVGASVGVIAALSFIPATIIPAVIAIWGIRLAFLVAVFGLWKGISNVRESMNFMRKDIWRYIKEVQQTIASRNSFVIDKKAKDPVIEESSSQEPAASVKPTTKAKAEKILTPIPSINKVANNSIADESLKRRVRAWLGLRGALELKIRHLQKKRAALKAKTKKDADEAQILDDVGGIDLNEKNLTINIKVDGDGIPLGIELQDAAMINIQGLSPVIRDIVPVTPASMPVFAELMKS